MIQRDWQKDMEMCKGFLEDSGWSRRDLIAEQPQMTMYWMTEVIAERVRTEAAEEREQKLIDIMHIIAFESDDEKTRKYASQMLSTIYTDTPSPKEQTDWLNEESCARCGRNKPVEGYEWCSECRPDLKVKEEGSLVHCPKCDNRNLIPHPNQANIWLCGPCNQVIEEGVSDNVD